MKNRNKLIICKLGNFYLPDINNKINYIFNAISQVSIIEKYIEIGEPDYVIGDYIAEYSIENLAEKITKSIDINSNELVFAFINESLEKNYFSYHISEKRISIISLKDIEDFRIDIEKYFLLGVVEHYLVHTKKHNWHFQARRCVFDFCADKKNITTSSQYLALCEECKNKIGTDGQDLINKVKNALQNNYNNFINNNMLSVFISYSHQDEELKKKLDIALSALKRSAKISTWNDRKIIPGMKWDESIKKELNNSNLILLLISSDFIASDYIWDVEIKKAIERHENKEAVVIPIFCRSCDFTDMPFAKIQGLPDDAKPLTSFANIDDGLTLVAKGIRSVAETFFI